MKHIEGMKPAALEAANRWTDNGARARAHTHAPLPHALTRHPCVSLSLCVRAVFMVKQWLERKVPDNPAAVSQFFKEHADIDIASLDYLTEEGVMADINAAAKKSSKQAAKSGGGGGGGAGGSGGVKRKAERAEYSE